MIKELSTYESIIHKSRYARFLDSKKRRETWPETVERYVNFISKRATTLGGSFTIEEIEEITQAILNREVVPSMRALMTAGEAAEREPIATFNCAYLAVNNKRAFSEALYILMCGTGLGFSCERQEIGKLPPIPPIIKEVDDVIVVGDSKLGWAKAYKKLLSSLWDGDIPYVDFSHVRGAGERLKVFGGRASGPAPLKKLFDYSVTVFMGARGRNLTSIEVHDILCTIGEVVVVGGVRRSALISLSNLTDRRMREAKVGAWWEADPQRALANNSVVYTEKPDVEAFMEEWISLIRSKSGERGVVNRKALQKQAAMVGRDATLNYGLNPCAEIILRDKEFCNLSEQICRFDDTEESLMKKTRVATILGTIQSSFTDFNFISPEWKTNCDEERLLGVSMTGVMDCPLLNGSGDREELVALLEKLKAHAREVNKEYAERLSISPSKAITCNKPSGTVSELVGSSSGIHPRYSKYYIRSIRQDNKDPVTQFLKDKGVRWEPSFGKEESTTVFFFPHKAPEGGCL